MIYWLDGHQITDNYNEHTNFPTFTQYLLDGNHIKVENFSIKKTL